MKPEVSILMPVYNVEKYLSKSVESIVKQTFRNWELIVVNDCSPDNSREILSRYEAKDHRIRVIDHAVNRGVSQARFTGLDHAQGKYIVFVDSDDWMPKNAIRMLYDRIEQEEADIAIGSMAKVLDNWGMVKTKPTNTISLENRTESITMPELYDKYFLSYFGAQLLFINMCWRIYRRTTIDKASLEPVSFYYGEDLVFNMKLHPFLSKIAFVPDMVYYYRYGGGTGISTPYLLRATKNLYTLREEYVRKYNYRVAIPYLKMELISNFYSHFQNLILLDKKSYSEVKILIEEELNEGIYDDSLFTGITCSEESIALQSKNVDRILTMVKKGVRARKPKHVVKKIVARILP